tara:strand:- start:29721 stop:29933 length:213 start_codon:yes stop_codon:yes gene_type:complete
MSVIQTTAVHCDGSEPGCHKQITGNHVISLAAGRQRYHGKKELGWAQRKNKDFCPPCAAVLPKARGAKYQ